MTLVSSLQVMTRSFEEGSPNVVQKPNLHERCLAHFGKVYCLKEPKQLFFSNYKEEILSSIKAFLVKVRSIKSNLVVHIFWKRQEKPLLSTANLNWHLKLSLIKRVTLHIKYSITSSKYTVFATLHNGVLFPSQSR